MKAQKRAVRHFRGYLYGIGSALAESPDGKSNAAATAAPTILRRAEKAMQPCITQPDFRGFVAAMRRLTKRPLDEARLRGLAAALEPWATRLGMDKAASGPLRDFEQCRAVLDEVSASYRVVWAWTDTGKEFWIELSIRNAGKRRMYATFGGSALATGLEASEHGQGPPPGVVHWGGSSADSADANPGVHTSRVYLLGSGTLEAVRTDAGGTFTVREFYATLYSVSGSGFICSLPVHATE